MRKKIAVIVVIALSLSLFSACGSDKGTTDTSSSSGSNVASGGSGEGAWDFSNADSVNLQVAMYLGDTDPTTLDLIRYLDKIKEYTEGTVDYTMNAGSTLAKGDEELDAVKSGLADVTFFPVAYGSGLLPLSFMLEYPGTPYKSDMASSYAINDWFHRIQPAELSDFKLLYAIGQGNGCFLTSTPIRQFSDLSGQQIRCGASQTPILEAYKAKPTVMVFSEVYEALRTGVVNGFYGMISAATNVKLYEVADYCTKDPYYIGAYITVMNKDAWEKLTPDQQAAIEQATEDAFAEFLAAGRGVDIAKSIEILESNDVEMIEFDAENVKLMGEASAHIQTEYAAGLDAKGLNGTEALELYKELCEKYNALY